MTLSPEERAREIAQSILLSPCSIPFLGTVTAEKIIAAALRAAENEAIERAAKVAEGTQREFSSANEAAAMAHNDACVDNATAIRALKTSA